MYDPFFGFIRSRNGVVVDVDWKNLNLRVQKLYCEDIS